MDTHTKTAVIRVHRADTDSEGQFTHADEDLSMSGEPDHQHLCDSEQAFVLNAIRNDVDLARHMQDAIQSLRICLAADESVRLGKAIDLPTRETV